jgi:predicted TIM-barrel enzyme
VPLDECVDKIQAMHDAAKAVNPEEIVICHGGPISESSDFEYVLAKTNGLAGFFGASSIERLPTEKAVQNTLHCDSVQNSEAGQSLIHCFCIKER